MNIDEYNELAEQLHEHVMGINADTAAVDLITQHGVWLRRRDFAPFVRHARYDTGEPMAEIRWRAAHTALRRGHLPCSGSEADVLAIACSLAIGVPISLRRVLGNLDDRNFVRVMRALGIANNTWPISQTLEIPDDF
jgi:hypothetical protein